MKRIPSRQRKLTDTEMLDWLDGPCHYLNIQFAAGPVCGILNCDGSGKRELRLAIRAAMKSGAKLI